jgi:hypothetical protein
MKRYRVLTAILTSLLLVTLLISGCGTILVTEDGKAVTGDTETRQYDLTEFTRVDISSAFTYEIKKADDYSISITANSDLFDDIRVVKKMQTLNIGPDVPTTTWKIPTIVSKLKVVITMPKLQGLESAGASRGTVTGFNSTEDMDISVSGASRVELQDISAGDTVFEVSGGSTMALEKIATGDTSFDMSGSSTVTGDITTENIELEVSGASIFQANIEAAGDVEMDVSGASRLMLQGSARNMRLEGTGASRLELENFAAHDALVDFSGATHGTINLDGRLDVNLSGMSRLEYEGQPSLGKIDVTGASTFRES